LQQEESFKHFGGLLVKFSTDAKDSTRREFCAQAASLLAAGALAGCGGGTPTSPSDNVPSLTSVSASVSGRTVSITIDSASALSSVGSAATTRTSLGTFLVAHTAQDSFTVLTATCTHEVCGITGFSNSRYVCPCHGSQFTTSGSVVMGPASRALQQYSSQFSNGVLTFSV
jgi:cytochrome b6-f complex iron-sulfur subunit